MDGIVSQHVSDLIAERDALKAELESMKHTMFFENSVSKSIYDRQKDAYEAVCKDNRKLSSAIDVQAERIAELTRQLSDLRRTLGGEE